MKLYMVISYLKNDSHCYCKGFVCANSLEKAIELFKEELSKQWFDWKDNFGEIIVSEFIPATEELLMFDSDCI